MNVNYFNWMTNNFINGSEVLFIWELSCINDMITLLKINPNNEITFNFFLSELILYLAKYVSDYDGMDVDLPQPNSNV